MVIWLCDYAVMRSLRAMNSIGGGRRKWESDSIDVDFRRGYLKFQEGLLNDAFLKHLKVLGDDVV